MKKHLFPILLIFPFITGFAYYTPVMPTGNGGLEPSSVNNAEKFSPLNLDRGWTVFDHIGVKDSAFKGAKHLATKSSGIQWYGYDNPPYNDLMLTNQDIPDDYTLNLKQATIVADWHTIDGGGLVFNATTDAPPNIEVSPSDNYKFRGHAIVATMDSIQLRLYDTTTQEFMADGSSYSVLAEVPKTCGSQSFTVTKAGDNYTVKLDDTIIYEGYLTPYGNHVGAMVDYIEHNCSSLSSVYMYNLTVNGKQNLFQKNSSAYLDI